MRVCVCVCCARNHVDMQWRPCQRSTHIRRSADTVLCLFGRGETWCCRCGMWLALTSSGARVMPVGEQQL
jgi:hypothetical protein